MRDTRWGDDLTRQANKLNLLVVFGGIFAALTYIVLDNLLRGGIQRIVVILSLVPVASGLLAAVLYYSGKIAHTGILLFFYIPLFAFFPYLISSLETELDLILFQVIAAVVGLTVANFSLTNFWTMALLSMVGIGSYFCFVPAFGQYPLREALHRGGLLYVILTALLPVISGVRYRLYLENYKLKQQVEKQNSRLEFYANNDHLTATFNRRGGIRILEQTLRWAQRHSVPLSISFIDIDGLKKMNDAHGHRAGDEYIVAVARAVSATIRASDTVCRLGGDEFLVILPDCDLENAELIMKKVSSSVEEEGEALSFPASISYGCAQYPEDGELGISEFIKSADDNMYRHKHSSARGRKV